MSTSSLSVRARTLNQIVMYTKITFHLQPTISSSNAMQCSQKNAPSPRPFRYAAQSKRRTSLLVLPSTSAGDVAGDSRERTNASRAEVNVLEVGKDLIDTLIVCGAGDETASPTESANAIASIANVGPAAEEAVVGVGIVGDGVLHCTGVAVDVDFLAAWNDCTHCYMIVSVELSGEG